VETLPGHLQRLPAGEDRFQAELLSHDQRGRILVAMASVVAERGYHKTTIEHIVKRAGVSRGTFYENFDSRESCLLAGFEATVEEVRRLTAAAAASEREWPDQIRAALAAFLDFVVANPALARTCLVETMTAGPGPMLTYEQALQSFTPSFRRGREFLAEGGAVPEIIEESIVGGIVWMLHQRILHGDPEEIPELLPTLLEFALAPYLGAKRAAEIAAAA
jgi:AcrR family transcriptional regulator